ncbi:MAG TPA: PEGA domain-containing protein [Polyangiaceae bacterium]|nr:PEGA domain-containing protein [Polyangiaceae bacterium]
MTRIGYSCAAALMIASISAGTRTSFAADPASVTPVSPDQEAEAGKHYNRAVELYTKGAYSEALAELIQTRALNHSYKVLFNIAQVRGVMQDAAGALQAYREYLAEGGAEINAQRREDVQKEIRDLEARVATLIVETDLAGAQVLIDSTPAGVTPLPAPLPINPGTHEVEVKHPEYPPQTRRVAFEKSRAERVAFTLAPPAPPKAVARLETSPTAQGKASTDVAPSDPRTTAKWIGWVGTGVLVTGAAVTGILALSANGSLAKLRDDPNSDHAAMQSKSDTTKTYAAVCDGFLIATAVAGGVSLWLTLSSPSSGEHAATTKKTPTLSVGAGPSAVQLRGTF